jgi:transcriptional regulator of arginine metabolism
MRKTERQNAIKDLIRSTRVTRQDELCRLLAEKGFSVTQASVSRDLEELGIVKVRGAYSLPQPEANQYALGLLSVEPAGENLVVVKFPSGLASAAAVRIDAARISGIVGTIAGDDTIFIAVADKKAQKAVMRSIWKIFEQ